MDHTVAPGGAHAVTPGARLRLFLEGGVPATPWPLGALTLPLANAAASVVLFWARTGERLPPA